jgi:invasion protein IalB
MTVRVLTDSEDDFNMVHTRTASRAFVYVGAASIALAVTFSPIVVLGQSQAPVQLAPPAAAPKPAAPKPAAPATAAPKPATPPATAPKPATPPATAPKPATPPAAAPKPAVPAAPQAAAPPADPNEPNRWVKLCSKNQEQKLDCLVAQEVRTDQGQPVFSVALRETEGESKRVLLIAVPPLNLIQPGLRIGVDKGKREEAKYTICFPNLCYAEMPVSDQFLASMKTGQALVVTTLNLQEKAQNFPLSLAGFKTTHEGEGIDPTAVQQTQQNQQQLQQELQKRAEEARQKLTAEQPKQP